MFRRFLLLLLLGGCSATGLVRDSHQPDLTGIVGVLRIGDQGYCTAVLVDESRILSAAHCFAYTSGGRINRPNEQLAFELGKHKYRLTYWYSLGGDLEITDMAIAGIDGKADMPTADLDRYDPASGDRLMFAGFGCRSGNSTVCLANPKMIVRYLVAPPEFSRSGFQYPGFMLYRGDSGGPLFNLETGGIVGIGSAYSWPDFIYFADTRTLHGML